MTDIYKIDSQGRIVTAQSTPTVNLTTQALAGEILLDNTTLGSSGSFDIDLSTITDGLTCEHLRIVFKGRGVVAGVDTDAVHFYLNNDTTNTNYYRQRLGALGATNVSDIANAPFAGNVPAATADANNFATLEFFIPDYRNSSEEKLVRVLNTQYATTTVMRVALIAIQWNNTSSINRLQIRTDNHPTDLFTTGSEIWVYGTKPVTAVTNVTLS